MSLIGKENVGLYRDDGLNAITSSSGPALDKMTKNIIALFEDEGQPISVETILFEKDFFSCNRKVARKFRCNWKVFPIQEI